MCASNAESKVHLKTQRKTQRPFHQHLFRRAREDSELYLSNNFHSYSACSFVLFQSMSSRFYSISSEVKSSVQGNHYLHFWYSLVQFRNTTQLKTPTSNKSNSKLILSGIPKGKKLSYSLAWVHITLQQTLHYNVGLGKRQLGYLIWLKVWMLLWHG